MNPDIDRFLDADAAYYTGCDGGIDAYVRYWRAQPQVHWNMDFWCYRIAVKTGTIGVITIFRLPQKEYDRIPNMVHLSIGAFWIDPTMRGRGIGTMILQDIFANTETLLGLSYHTAQAVVYPDNTLSRRAFEKAGFRLHHTHPDGDAQYFTRLSEDSIQIASSGTMIPYKFVVIFTREGDRWLYVRQKGRTDYETPGGHIEPGESPEEAARRELYEETGVKQSKMHVLFDYAVSGAFDSAAGQVFLADVTEREALPESEIAAVMPYERYPEQLHYPQILPKLYAKVIESMDHSGKMR